MEYKDFNWDIEKDIKMLIDYANDKFKGEDREWTIEILYWRDKDRMIELRSGRDYLPLMVDVIRLRKGIIKYYTTTPKAKIESINVLEVMNVE